MWCDDSCFQSDRCRSRPRRLSHPEAAHLWPYLYRLPWPCSPPRCHGSGICALPVWQQFYHLLHIDTLIPLTVLELNNEWYHGNITKKKTWLSFSLFLSMYRTVLVYLWIVAFGEKFIDDTFIACFMFFRCRFRVLDSFGTEPAFNLASYARSHGYKTLWGSWGLQPLQYMTMFRKCVWVCASVRAHLLLFKCVCVRLRNRGCDTVQQWLGPVRSWFLSSTNISKYNNLTFSEDYKNILEETIFVQHPIHFDSFIRTKCRIL